MTHPEPLRATQRWDGLGLTITITKSDDQEAYLRLAGCLDSASAPLLQACLENQLAIGRRYVRMDLSGLSFVDSAGLSVIADAHEVFLARRGTLVLTRLGPRTWRLLQVVGLDDELLIAVGRPAMALRA
jgi:anti-sigma B factor antagonist